MLLTISTTHQPATDLGYLLHKYPGRCQSFSLSFGEAHVYYPEATDSRCTAALQVEVDPIRLVRRGPGSARFALAQYVNDRPYVASSLLSVAIGDVYRSSLIGQSRDRADLALTPIPLEIGLSAIRCRGGEAVLRRLFEPLGYDRIEAVQLPLDERFPEWGSGPAYCVTLGVTARLQDVLRQLTVLIPVLDDDKHYWFGEDELDKLLRRGEGWLDQHPERKLIADRYLRYRRALVRHAIERMAISDGTDPDGQDSSAPNLEETVERPISLHEERLKAVAAVLRDRGVQRVVDLGCGEGKLILQLVEDRQFTEILGVDASSIALAHAARRIHLDRWPAEGRVRLIHGALTYRDKRLAGFDAAAIVEVIEHLDPFRLAAFERVVFESARPGLVVVTTPNQEYNQLFDSLASGSFRHPDHRFEWTRPEFASWAEGVADRFGYAIELAGIGPVDPDHGQPSQMAIFSRPQKSKPETQTAEPISA
ncbi:MAG TPA: 3' terminal RNA ribose 2'-O-methyltransferase Hen1 [Thermomicrobiales bacterium]|nr:3' terminal RNA ribose 2'-O-methyltransferase Hen1 [Thermomicrobiales bacterium]